MAMTTPATLDRTPGLAAAAILGAFEGYVRRFREVTRRARSRFERRDWHGMQADALERLDLYGRAVDAVVAEFRKAPELNRAAWAGVKSAYAAGLAPDDDAGLAGTFFNSVARRVFTVVGVDPAVEFLLGDTPPPPDPAPVFKTFPALGPLAGVIEQMLASFPFAVPFEDPERDAGLTARAIERHLRATGAVRAVDSLDVVPHVFYRNQGAYLVGRARAGDAALPLALAVHNEGRGLFVDAAVFTEDEVSVLFGFTRSYFHVEADRPRDLIAFLASIMPRKSTAELYTAVGFNKHGKTELYRDLVHHIARSSDRFEPARGDRGMVMIVFTLPSFDVVFKVIRDHFAYPKTTTRKDVIDRYQLVFKHDRAGRLADVQEFEHLAFPRERFTEGLLAELASEAAGDVSVGETVVNIKHLYTERRMVPLNLYLREADPKAAREAVVDYGRAVKELASTNIFPGDMLPKNFGVTRHGRVVFYDYDELCLVTDCHFRDMPSPSGGDEEFDGEPWFYVGPHDVFPEEFLAFLGLTGDLRETFLRHHTDLLTPRYWRALQERHEAGDLLDIIPYAPARRFGQLDTVPYRRSRRLEES